MRGSSRESHGVVDAGQSMVPYDVSWGELCPLGPQSRKSKSQPPGPPNVTVFGKRIWADSSVKMRSHWSTMSPLPATAVLIRRGDLGTDAHTERTPGEHKGRHGGGTVHKPRNTSGLGDGQGTPGNQGRSCNAFSLPAFRRNQPYRHLNLGRLAPSTVRRYVSVSQAARTVALCHGGPNRLSTSGKRVPPSCS